MLWSGEDVVFFSETQVTSFCGRVVRGCFLDDGPFDIKLHLLFFELPYVFRQFGSVCFRFVLKGVFMVAEPFFEGSACEADVQFGWRAFRCDGGLVYNVLREALSIQRAIVFSFPGAIAFSALSIISVRFENLLVVRAYDRGNVVHT